MNFGQLKEGARARIVKIQSSTDLARFLEMGLTEGTEFEVEKIAPFGDTMEIRLRGYCLCLRQGEMKGIVVELI